ncbi:MAG: hypothetical protein WAL50_09860, partial [Kineosporiaceae bacterium]
MSGAGAPPGLRPALKEALGAEVAAAFGLGGDAVLVGPVASGRMGHVWCLDTVRGRHAVKESFDGWAPADVEQDAVYQETVRAHGVPMPAVVRSVRGDVLATVGGAQVRVYEWVGVLGPTRSLDPAAVGRTVAAIHSVHVPASLPVDPW